MSFRARIYLACPAFAAWTALLWVGWSAGGWAHLLLGAALLTFPWRAQAVPALDTDRARRDAEEPS